MVARYILKRIAWIVGFVFLWTKFKGKKSFNELQLKAEENSFSLEGGKVILFIVGLIILIPTIFFLFAFIFRLIIDFFKNL
jgi:hypothetical protein